MGGGAHSFMVESLAQVAGEFRENRGILHWFAVAGGSSDLLAQNHGYLRISSKKIRSHDCRFHAKKDKKVCRGTIRTSQRNDSRCDEADNTCERQELHGPGERKGHFQERNPRP